MDMTVEDLYPDQAFLLFRTGVLVGVHGAALNNMMWMRPLRGAVVEIRGGNSNHRTTAIRLGHGHFMTASLAAPNIAGVVTGTGSRRLQVLSCFEAVDPRLSSYLG